MNVPATQLSLLSRKQAAARRRLVEAGVSLFVRQSGQDITSREVAREAGVNHAGVNYHFGTLFSLMDEVVDECIDRLLAILSPELEKLDGCLKSEEPERIAACLPSCMEGLLAALSGEESAALLRALSSGSGCTKSGVYGKFSRRILEPLHERFSRTAALLRGISEESLEAASVGQFMTAQCMAFFRGGGLVMRRTGRTSFSRSDLAEIAAVTVDGLCRMAGIAPAAGKTRPAGKTE